MSHLVIRLLPSLCPGARLTVVGSRYPLFSRQGDWDGASALHCTAMALALLGKLRDPSQVWRHDRSAEGRFWTHAWPHIPHGLTLPEVASFIWELNTGVQPVLVEGGAAAVLRVCLRELATGTPVIIGWCHRATRQARAALVVGVEQRSNPKGPHSEPGHSVNTADALLLLDPTEPEPRLAAFNARLAFTAAGERLTYVTASTTHPVELEGMVSVRQIKKASQVSQADKTAG